MPLLWGLLPSLRIDLAQTAGVLATLICLMRPTTRRWALGGVLLGLTILVKETVLVLGLLPLAAVGFVPGGGSSGSGSLYLAAAAAVAAWWWIVVWQQAGVIFPFNAIGVIERRGVGTDIGVDPYGVAVIAIVVAAWVVVVRRARRDYPSRLLAVGAACLVLPAVYATLNGLSTRNYAGLAVLSAVAIGVAVASLAGPVRSRLPGAVGRSASVGARDCHARRCVVRVRLPGECRRSARTGNPEPGLGAGSATGSAPTTGS